MLDKSIIARNFGRFANEYTGRALVQEQIARDLLANIPQREYKKAADLGCGPGVNLASLRKLADRVNGYDLAPEMCKAARGLKLTGVEVIEGNIEEVSLKDFDLIFSSLALQWCDFKKFWQNLNATSLENSSKFIALALPVTGTMAELKAILRQAGIKGRVNTFPDASKLKEVVLSGAIETSETSTTENSRCVVNKPRCIQAKYISVYYDVKAYLASVRGIGAGAADGAAPLTRQEYRRFMAILEDKLKRDGKLEHTYEVMFIVG